MLSRIHLSIRACTARFARLKKSALWRLDVAERIRSAANVCRTALQNVKRFRLVILLMLRSQVNWWWVS